MTVFSNDLQGGIDQITVNINEIIPGCNNIYLSPNPNEYLFTTNKSF